MSEQVHVVRFGDHVARLAWEYGVAKSLILEHPRNKVLWEKGRTATMLCAGDVLYIPERDDAAVEVELGGDNAYTTEREKMFVRVRLVVDGEPASNEQYEFRRDADAQGSFDDTDADGVATIEIDAATRSVTILLGPDLIVLLVGALAPLSEQLGVAQRLSNLGFRDSEGLSIDGQREREDFATRAAVGRFQHDKKGSDGLRVTGVADEATRDAVRRSHGQ